MTMRACQLAMLRVLLGAAAVAGCRVRQRVQMPFQFTIDRRRN
jgi:hypothetical protein